MTISDRLRTARVDAGFERASDAATAFGWNANTYRSHENGNRGIPRSVVVQYAKAFHVPVSWLMTGISESRDGSQADLAFHHVPVLLWNILPEARRDVATVLRGAGEGATVAVPRDIAGRPTFAVRVRDSAMASPNGSRDSLYDGDTALVDATQTPSAGKTVLLWDAATGMHHIRKVRALAAKRVQCYPLNPDHHTIEMEIDDPAILGVVTGFFRAAP